MATLDDEVGRVFYALSDPTRRRILEDLRHCDGQRPHEIALGFDISRQAILKHLRVLEEVGLVVARRRTRETVYYLDHDPMRRAHAEWLQQFLRLRRRR